MADLGRFPTYVSEVDFAILQQLPDSELASACRVDTYASQICRDDYFWKVRAEQRMPSLLYLKDQFASGEDPDSPAMSPKWRSTAGVFDSGSDGSWQNFYQQVISSVYLIVGSGLLSAHTDIKSAFLVATQDPEFKDQPLSIYLIGPERPIHPGDDTWLLFTSDTIQTQPLYGYPVLNPPQLYILYASIQPADNGKGLADSSIHFVVLYANSGGNGPCARGSV